MLLAKDEVLALRAQSGASVDFDALVDRYAARIHAFCMRATGSPAMRRTDSGHLWLLSSAWAATTDRPFGPWL